VKGGGPPMLMLRGVGKTFSNGVVALRDVDLDIREGDFISLLGPSGCGKSTALRLIAGLGTPTAGLLDWRGAGFSGRGNIGFVFQEPTLLPWANVFDNVWLPLRLKGVSRREGDAGDPRDARTRAPDRLREGGAARTFRRHEDARLDRPRPRDQAAILLMDEPFAALDEITRFKLNNDLLELWQDERFTVVFVTHSACSRASSCRPASWSWRRGRGGSIREIAVDAPYPRDEAFRTSAEYASLCRQASEVLVEAIDATHLAPGDPYDGH
jgi:NitT/TauT family transport system ATP-binding protein